MNYLYFAEGTVDSTGEGMMFPASNFIGLDATSSTTTDVFFKDHDNAAGQSKATLKHAAGKHKEVAELLIDVVKPSPGNRGKFIVVSDEENSVYLDNGNGAGLTTPVELVV
jgi:hypothetical protein|tara:strand:- start:858 stop:1190 length:333 start_codon:yes stop_codon:yes gene_type:complete